MSSGLTLEATGAVGGTFLIGWSYSNLSFFLNADEDGCQQQNYRYGYERQYRRSGINQAPATG